MSRSNNTLRAQPVSYAGIPFKSKAEAKWAAFFDRLRVAWAYEPTADKPFKTDHGGYIPDFYLPALDTWWEVKGAIPNRWALRAGEFVVRATGRPLCLAWGPIDLGGQGRILALLGGAYVSVNWAICTICGRTNIRPLDGGDPPGCAYHFHHRDLLAALAFTESAQFTEWDRLP